MEFPDGPGWLRVLSRHSLAVLRLNYLVIRTFGLWTPLAPLRSQNAAAGQPSSPRAMGTASHLISGAPPS